MAGAIWASREFTRTEEGQYGGCKGKGQEIHRDPCGESTGSRRKPGRPPRTRAGTSENQGGAACAQKPRPKTDVSCKGEDSEPHSTARCQSDAREMGGAAPTWSTGRAEPGRFRAPRMEEACLPETPRTPWARPQVAPAVTPRGTHVSDTIQIRMETLPSGPEHRSLGKAALGGRRRVASLTCHAALEVCPFLLRTLRALVGLRARAGPGASAQPITGL